MMRFRDYVIEVDTRTKLQKMQDLRDHPNTEPGVRAAAERAISNFKEPVPRSNPKVHLPVHGYTSYDTVLNAHGFKKEPDHPMHEFDRYTRTHSHVGQGGWGHTEHAVHLHHNPVGKPFYSVHVNGAQVAGGLTPEKLHGHLNDL